MIERISTGLKLPEPSHKQLSLFGYIGAFLTAALATYLGSSGSHWDLPWAAISALLLTLTLFSRDSLLRIYRLWAYLGLALGWVNLRLLMALLLYVVFTPVRFAHKLVKRDPLNRKFDKQCDSYLQTRKPLSSNHFEKMF